MEAPSRAKRVAHAAPIPEAAPVMRATVSSSWALCSLLSLEIPVTLARIIPG